MEQENDITVATPTPTAASLPVHSLSTYERTRRQSLDEWFKMRENCAQQYGWPPPPGLGLSGMTFLSSEK